MARTPQYWLVAVRASDDPLPSSWVADQPDLLSRWPMGRQTRVGIERGDELVYYAAHHQKVIALARATEPGGEALDGIRVQVRLAIPVIEFAPHWRVTGKPSDAMMGQKATRLSDSEYKLASDATRGCSPSDATPQA